MPSPSGPPGRVEVDALLPWVLQHLEAGKPVGPTLLVRYNLHYAGKPAPLEKGGKDVQKVPLVLDVFSHAGGTGKTTLVRELAFALNARGLRVLMLDLDPQANLTAWLLGDQVYRIDPHSTLLLYVEKMALPDPIPIRPGLDLIPSNLDLARAEAFLSQHPLRGTVLRHDLRKLPYDLVLIDSLPSMGNIAIMGALASDELLVPVETTAKGIQAVGGVLSFAREYALVLAKSPYPPKKSNFIGCFVPTKYDSRSNAHREALEAIRKLASMAPVTPPTTYRPAVYAQAIEKGLSAGEISPAVREEMEAVLQYLGNLFPAEVR